jgi:hypothetical protein
MVSASAIIIGKNLLHFFAAQTLQSFINLAIFDPISEYGGFLIVYLSSNSNM